MDTNKKKKTILDLLDDVELELLQKDTGYAKRCLQEEGVDIDKEKEFASQFMKKIRFMARAMSNKKQDSALLEKAFERVKKALSENVRQTSEALMSLLQNRTPSVQYRKLESWTDDEIRDVLADIDIVKLMEELDKE